MTKTYTDYYYECTLSWTIKTSPGTEFAENISLNFQESTSKFIVVKTVDEGTPPPSAPFPQIRKMDPIDLNLSYLLSRVKRMGPNFDLLGSLNGKVWRRRGGRERKKEREREWGEKERFFLL